MAGGITYKELTKLIEKFCSNQASGTLFLRTENNRSGMLMFREGAIIGVTFGVTRGQKAISEIRNTGNSVEYTYRFQEGRPPPIRQDLGSPEETLIALGVIVKPDAEPLDETLVATSLPPDPPPAAAEPEKPPADDTPAPEALREASLEMDGLIRTILSDEMIDHLGPAASVVITEAEQTAGGLTSRRQIDQVLSALCQDLEPAEQEEFKRAIRERTSSLFTKTACTLVTEELNEYVGPVAASMCDEHIQRLGGGVSSPEELQRLVEALAAEIEDQEEAQTFIANIRTGLRQLSA